LRYLLELAPAKVIATVQETRRSLKNPALQNLIKHSQN